MTRNAFITRRPKSINDHTIVAVAEVPSNMARWDRAIHEIESALLVGITTINHFPEAYTWDYLEYLEAKYCRFESGLVVYTDAGYVVNYRYVVLKGSIPFNLTFEEAANATDSKRNFSCVFPCREGSS